MVHGILENALHFLNPKNRNISIFEDFLDDPQNLWFWDPGNKISEGINNLVIPEDLEEALNGNPPAKANFEVFSDSIKKQILFWIKSAKRPETRIKRIEKVVISAAENKRPFWNLHSLNRFSFNCSLDN